MNELTKTNQNLTKKEALGQYVHDMVDLEIRAFSLRKTAEETRKEAEKEKRNAAWKLENAKKEIKNREINLQCAQSAKVSSDPIKKGVIAFFISFLPAGVMMSLAFMDVTGLSIGIGAIISAFVFLITMIVRIAVEREEIAENIISQKALLNEGKTTYSTELKKHDKKIHCIQTLYDYAEQLDKDITEIETALQKITL